MVGSRVQGQRGPHNQPLSNLKERKELKLICAWEAGESLAGAGRHWQPEGTAPVAPASTWVLSTSPTNGLALSLQAWSRSL